MSLNIFISLQIVVQYTYLKGLHRFREINVFFDSLKIWIGSCNEKVGYMVMRDVFL